ncbi:MAG TPA: hypothetical protein DEO88_04070 [Syntrophobacteraceae bacterium]|nr:hypothetical protein [Syntrophobacteraceae bacterium]
MRFTLAHSSLDQTKTRIIINADDLGRSAVVNDAIFALMARGLVTSATVMANGPALGDCLRRIGAFPACSFGVHLNITQFQPLTALPALGPILDGNGEFSRERLKHALLNIDLKHAIYQEWSAQIQKLRSLGMPISHLDSHHDVHTDPRLFLTLKQVQRSFAIRKVRIATNISPDPKLRFRKNRLWNLALRHCYRTTTTCGLADFSTFLQAANKTGRHHLTVELVVHPGHPRFVPETRSLDGPWAEKLPFPVRLISYADL